MSRLTELRDKTGRQWDALFRAEANAEAALKKAREALTRPRTTFDSEDVSIVAFGSLARREWTAGSDLDWTLLVDGQANAEHVTTARRIGQVFSEAGFKLPGRTGVFGNTAFSHAIIHQIGGQDDTNRNTTQRLLLLLESLPLGSHDQASNRVVAGVDYASKVREREGEGWGIRNIKLRMSRKLLFASGLLTCFSCDPRFLRLLNPVLAADPTVEGVARHLMDYTSRPPLEILAEALLLYDPGHQSLDILACYDEFLRRLDDQHLREHLENRAPDQADSDTRFQDFQDVTRSFQKALKQLFFRGDEVLADLTREYGVF
jgi:predicted nucleotidyltransferase